MINYLSIGVYFIPCDCYCADPENIHTPPTEGIGISWGVGGFYKAKKFKEMYEAYLEFPEGWWGGGGGALEKIPSVGEVWIFSGITHCDIIYDVQIWHPKEN